MNQAAISGPKPRYGRRQLRGGRRRGVIAVAVLAVAAGTVLAVIGYQRLGSSDVTGELAGYELIDDHTVRVIINVTRSDPSQPVDCIVRVRAKDGSETGRREVLVGPSSAATVSVTATLKSSKRAVVGDIYGCGTDVPAYLRAPERPTG